MTPEQIASIRRRLEGGQTLFSTLELLDLCAALEQAWARIGECEAMLFEIAAQSESAKASSA